ICEAPKYTDLFTLPHGIQGYFDYKQALACSKKLNKPIFVDFTGHGCVNCREMEANVWSNPEVLKRLKNDFIVLALYVDDKTELPKEEWYTSSYDNKVKSSIGKQNADLQITKFNNNAQPFYLILDSNGQLITNPVAYDLDPEPFIQFLKDGVANFKPNSGL
ncbi:MAG: thioredoxin family protein, partial [Cytophagales bacterium]|nr:thioredoxin family protein [Cytophagales bacterium]